MCSQFGREFHHVIVVHITCSVISMLSRSIKVNRHGSRISTVLFPIVIMYYSSHVNDMFFFNSNPEPDIITMRFLLTCTEVALCVFVSND